jgi:restriction endonuclease Mrr
VQKKLNRDLRYRDCFSANAEGFMADDEQEEEVIEPLPTGETEEERERIRRSNDLDQRMEREGIVSRHNRGYDEAADGKRPDTPKG